MNVYHTPTSKHTRRYLPEVSQATQEGRVTDKKNGSPKVEISLGIINFLRPCRSSLNGSTTVGGRDFSSRE